MRLGLVYLPPPDVSDTCVRWASTLAPSSRVVVGPNALPHVTLLHVESDEPEGLWRQAHVLPRAIPLSILACGLVRYDEPYNAPPAPPATMAWLILPCSRALRSAEERSVELAARLQLAPTTGNGDRFQPHITLAILEGDPGVIPPLSRDLFGRKFQGALALGVIGANGTYVRTLLSR